MTSNLCFCTMIVELLFRTNVRGVNMTRRYVIINKRRFFTFITLMLLIFIGLATLIVASHKAHSQEEIYFNEYRVGEGDTLWKISNYFSDENIDIRQFIYEIKKLNDMETSAIYEGDIIKIPTNQ